MGKHVFTKDEVRQMVKDEIFISYELCLLTY